MFRRAAEKRKALKLPQLKDLLSRRPMVSAPMIQRALKVLPEGTSYQPRQLSEVHRL
jgi:HTH DNA binding domain